MQFAHKGVVDHTNCKRTKAEIGSSLTEYTLVGALLVGISVVALQLLGNTVNTSLATMLTKHPSIEKPNTPPAVTPVPNNQPGTPPLQQAYVSTFTQSQLKHLQMSGSERVLPRNC